MRNLVGIAGKPHARTVVACIGPKTAETATEFGLRVDVQPERATVADLVEALAEYAVRLREQLATMPTKQRRGSKSAGPDRAAVPVIRGGEAAVSYPCVRPRRLRQTAAFRRLVAETRLSPAELVLPLFVREGLTEPRPIASHARGRAALPGLAAQGG